MSIKEATQASKIRIVCISDTHGHAPGEGYKLPAGDVLIHAGDLTNQGGLKEFQKAATWLSVAEHKIKIVVAGNHDLSLDKSYDLKHESGWGVESNHTEQCRSLMRNIPGLIYLEHESALIDVGGRQLTIFGSPYSIDAGKQNWAFQYESDQAKKIWSDVPATTDILITHSPPLSYLDMSSHWTAGGCPALLEVVQTIHPRLHIFGHHHEGRGAVVVDWKSANRAITSWSDPGAGNSKQSLLDLTCRQLNEDAAEDRSTTFVNASIMKTSWSRSARKEFNKPIVLTIYANQFATS